MISPTVIDLSSLPAPDVIQTISFEDIVQAARDDLVARFPLIVGVIDLESEPARKLIEVFAYREMLIRARVNDAARAVMLAFSQGTDLDALGALWGVTRLVGENDARFKARIQLAPDAFSVAGPDGAYQYHALTANVDIRDVATTVPVPGQIILSVLMEGPNPVPSADVLGQVFAAVSNDENVRPLTDAVSVVAAVLHNINLGVNLTLYPGPDAAIVLAAATASINAFIETERYLGHDLLLQGLTGAARVPGVYRADLTGITTDLILADTDAFNIASLNVAVIGRAT